MTKKLKRGFLISALCATCMATAVLGVHYGASNVSAVDAQLNVELQSSYTLGQTFTAPKATLSYEGQSYQAESYLTYPDGTICSMESYLLDEAGLYVLTYKAFSSDGKLLEERKSFTVSDALYSVSSERSSAYYGSHDKYGTDKKGIVVSLANGDVFTYNKVVDLSNKTYEDGLISFFNTPEIEGIQDASSLIVRFTDLYDENNYFEVDFHNQNYACATAAPLDAPKVGLDRNRSTATDVTWTVITFENEQYRMFQGNTNFGTPLVYRMQSSTKDYTLGETSATLSYDYDLKRVYAKPFSTYLGDGLVADLDHDLFFKNNWKGFTTGETIVSIYGSGYAASAMNFVVTDVNGDDLSASELKQDVTTILEVDTFGYKETELPYGIVGEKYKLFDAKITRPFIRSVTLEKRVYLNYHSNKSEINVQNGYFIPTLAGAYTIEYSVTDSFGVKTIKTFDVNVKPVSCERLSLRVGDDGAKTGDVFDNVRVPSVFVDNVSGKGELKVVAVSPSGVETAVDISNWSFTPMETGTYTVRYSVSDYLAVDIEETQIEIYKVSDPKFLDNPVLNAYYVKGATYSTPTLFAYYIDGEQTERKQASVYISYNGGERELLGEKVKIKQEGAFSLIFVATVNGSTIEKAYPLTAIDVGYGVGNSLHVHDYIQADEVVTGERGTYNGASAPLDNDVAFTFIHSVGAWNFSIDLMPHGSSYDCLELVLTDSEEPSIALAIVLTANETSTQAVVNGRYQVQLNKEFSGKKFSIAYAESTKTVTFDLKQSVEVVYNADESVFSGFPSKKVFVSFVLKNVTDAYTVQVAQLNGHVFTSRSDGVDPSVYYEGIVANTVYEKGDIITIPRFYVEDVVDIAPKLGVSVKDPAGNFVTSVDNILLDGTQPLNRTYEVCVTQVGVYKCWYTVEDYSENDGRKRLVNYTVEDSTPPTVKLSKANIYYMVGSTVTIASATVTDDESISKNCVVETYVKTPSNYYQVLTTSTFKANEKGEYIVYYFVYDEVGNLTVVQYTITVY